MSTYPSQGLLDAFLLAERRRKEAQRLSGVGFWEVNIKLGSIYWSEETYAIYELSEDVTPNYEMHLSLVHDDDREAVDAAYKKSVETGEEYNIRYRIRVGGIYKWIEARCVTCHDADGMPERSIGTAQDITETIAAQEQIERLAYHDALTDLPNRRLFSDRISMAIRQAERTGINVVVLFIDLDNFKDVNDRYGHEVGDEVLVGIADRLRNTARQTDTFARIGGDEFAGILIDVETDSIDSAAQKIKAAIDGVYKTKVSSFNISSSIGVTVYPVDSEESDILLRHADQAMYEAKENGKSRICFFDTDKQRSNQSRRALLRDIETAIHGDQLQLYFQPRINLIDGTAAGAEALLRWFTPQGPIEPSTVVAAIHNSHLEWDLDTWVIKTQLAHIGRFLESGISGPFSLNVCPSTIENPDFPAHLSRLLTASSVSGEHIEIEILEVSSIENFARTEQNLRQCKQLGINFSLDDFGTGFSSLTHFHSLTIDKLKIDKGFVRRLNADAESLALVKSILAIAKNSRRPVIAEGVETDAIATTLAQLGCEYAQGFGIARPMPASEYIAWANAWVPRAFQGIAIT